ncbi:hypothetical protein IFM89_011173 [Coptis chinensis]|uniref:Uncharacterized protein n=1 Tax=Coptis chinensis TaxID=261450 RepID=A0A835HSE2_9MAGN|nr:hypothetical protein IFM89_011173 [Coptis chinensis]
MTMMTNCLSQVDKASDPDKLKIKANEREDVICVSALTGDGLQDFCDEVQVRLKEYTEKGTLVRAHVPLPLARQLTPMRQLCAS